MMNWVRLWAALLSVTFVLLAGTAAIPQVVNLLSPNETASAPDVAALIAQAAENGIGVIVIDTNGNVLSPSARPEIAETSDAPAMSQLMSAQENANAFRAALFERFSTLPVSWEQVLYVLRATSPDGTILQYFKILLTSLALFAVGMIAEHYIYGRGIARHFIVPRIDQDPVGYGDKVPFLALRFVGGVVGVLFSMLVAYAIGVSIYGTLVDSSVQYTATLINIGYFSARVVSLAWRMILSPYLSQYRIPRLSDSDARKLHLWLCSVVILGVFALLFSAWIGELGLSDEIRVFFGLLLSFGVMVLIILLIFANARAITGAILDNKDILSVSLPLRIFARLWVPAALAYLVFAWGEQVYDTVLGLPPGIPLLAGAYVILTVVFIVYGGINFLIERAFARARAIRALNNADQETEDIAARPDFLNEIQSNRITTFEGLARRLAALLAFVAGVYAFVSFWAPGTDMMTDSLPNRTLDVLVIMFIGYFSFHAFRIWIDDKIREEQGDQVPGELGDEGGASSASRLATLLPLFKNFVLIVIVVTVALIVLMELGVNVGPLFAGAGIVGVAVGFGSQSLVRDIFSGAFFLFDDAFRKGEYIEIGDVKGTVENISVRSFQLRHHLGKLHTIPFGEIQVLSNYSRDWVMMKLPLRVTYDTDVDKVRKLVKKLGQELLNDPVIGDDFIQPLKSQGVIEMQDSAMIIRVKFMTRPGDQWLARKRVYEEIRALFEREGIKFAHREVTVRLADGEEAKNLTPAQKDSVIAAAEAAIEDEDIQDAPAGDDR
ncbi:MAG: mechanosensitive ion channel family protein [Paracoccaceae bacterium]